MTANNMGTGSNNSDSNTSSNNGTSSTNQTISNTTICVNAIDMTNNKTLLYCYTPPPIYQIGSDQSALIIAIIFIVVVMILVLYAVHHKFFDPYLEKVRKNLCKGTQPIERTVVTNQANEHQPLSNIKPSHVVFESAIQENNEYKTASPLNIRSVNAREDNRQINDIEAH